jgi:transaldolase
LYQYVLLRDAYNHFEAMMFKTLLEQNGIPVKVEQGALGRVYGISSGGIGEIKILVPEKYLKKADRICKRGKTKPMKIFLDTANILEIKEAVSMGMVDGVTTNPSLMAKESGRKLEDIIHEICKIVDGPVSVEALSNTAEEMFQEGKRLHAISPKNIVIKIPMCEEGLKAIGMLSKANIPTNCTLIFSVNQGILAIKAGASYVSPFVGRLDDIGEDGMQVVEDLLTFIENYGFDTEIIAASVRHPLHVTQVALSGAHIATIPFNILKKMVHHPLTDKGIDAFNQDWVKFTQAIK